MGLARTVVLVLGAVYVLIGVLGFVPQLVTGETPADMPSAEGNLLGIFPVNWLHNVVHLLIGAALLWGATATANAIQVARGVGILYIAVGLLGLVAPDLFGLMPIGGPDIILHVLTGGILLWLGFLSPETRAAHHPT
jgi:hypothetical protein